MKAYLGPLTLNDTVIARSYLVAADKGVTYGPSIPGYPSNLGKADLTSVLNGVGEVQNKSTAFSAAQYPLSNPNAITRLSGYMDPITGFIDADVVSLNQELSTAVQSAIYTVQAGSQSGVFLGEILETVRMIRNPAVLLGRDTARLVDEFKGLKKARPRPRNPRKVPIWEKEIIRDWSETWLAWVYGAIPLARDIENHVDQVNNLLKKRKFKLAKAKVADVSTRTQASFQVVAGFPMLQQGESITKYKGRGQALVGLYPSGPHFVPQNFGMRCEDFVPTIYELVPYSFLLDYFSNLNDYINSYFTVWEGVAYAWAGCEEVKEIREVQEPVGASSSLHVLLRATPGRVEAKQRSVARWKVSSQTQPILVSGCPSIKQCVNIAALSAALAKIRF